MLVLMGHTSVIEISSLLAMGGAIGVGVRAAVDRWLHAHGQARLSAWNRLCEVATASGCAAVGVTSSSAAQLLSGMMFTAWCVALAAVDVAAHRLPNWWTGSGYAVALVGAIAVGRPVPAIAGSVMLAGIHLVMHLVSPASMGAGDVKLALPLGAVTGLGGAHVWLWSALLGPVLTAGFGVAVLLRRRRGGDGRSALAHGPSMCLAAWAATVVSWCVIE